MPIFEFSAEFGGDDAADALLPHFRALKKAARETSLPAFPFPELSFILRVDGTVHAYGPSGLDHLDVDRKGKYVSVDISVTIADRDRLGGAGAPNAIVDGIINSVHVLKGSPHARLKGVDYAALNAALRALCDCYQRHVDAHQP